MRKPTCIACEQKTTAAQGANAPCSATKTAGIDNWSSPVIFTTMVQLLLTLFSSNKHSMEEVLTDVEWTTIVFFTGLFIVVGGMVETGVIDKLANILVETTAGHPIITMIVLLWASAILSSILDNIPFVATLIPLIIAMGNDGVDVVPLWWAVSLGACLGGNGTLIGASANVVLCGISGKHGHPITFQRFLKTGVPIMLMSVAISTIYVVLRYGI